jgi:hypothetical protein
MRVLDGPLNPRDFPLIRRQGPIAKNRVNPGSCAIITRIHEWSGPNLALT